jgi:hypothetical protein
MVRFRWELLTAAWLTLAHAALGLPQGAGFIESSNTLA